MKNKNFVRKRQAIYILSNRKSTRIIKTLMDFFFFIKVKIKMVCFSVPSAPAQEVFPFRGNGLPFHHTGSSQPAVTPSAAGVSPCSSAMSLISVDKVFVLLWASSGTFAVTACPTVAGRVFKRSRIKYRAPML